MTLEDIQNLFNGNGTNMVLILVVVGILAWNNKEQIKNFFKKETKGPEPKSDCSKALVLCFQLDQYFVEHSSEEGLELVSQLRKEILECEKQHDEVKP